jgi:hypothetical protein
MNLEHKKNTERKENIVSVPLQEVILKQLGTEYLDSGKFIPVEVGKEFKEIALPRFLEMLYRINNLNEVEKVFGSINESIVELTDPKEYWKTKEKLIKNFGVLSNQEMGGERARNIFEALKYLSYGDPDFDKFRDSTEILEEKFEASKNYWEVETASESSIPGGREFKVQISENILLNTYFGPVYDGAKISRLCFQFLSNDGQKIYHIDDVARLSNTTIAALDRRLNVGTLHDFYISLKNGQIEFNRDDIPKAQEASVMQFDEKDINGTLELFFREMRKRIGVVTSIKNPQREKFSVSDFGELLDIESIFKIRELCHNNGQEIKKIFEDQLPVQKMFLFAEMILMMEKNAILSMRIFHDTGLDVLIFGRHLTRKEFLGILSSKHLNFYIETNVDEENVTVGEKICRNYVSSINTDESNFIGLIEAIGEVLGPVDLKKSHGTHLKSGWEILTNPEDKVLNLKTIDLGSGLKKEEKEMLEVLISNGSLTVKAWHKLLMEKYPKSWGKSDRKTFNRIKKNINKYLEVSNRLININKKIKPVRFYYPCVSSTKIRKVLYAAGKENKLLEETYQSLGVDSIEGIMSLTSQELRESGILGNIMSILNPFILSYLIELQNESEKKPAAASYLDLHK